MDVAWADNGPGWVGVLLADAEAVLTLKPGYLDPDTGVAGPYPAGSPSAFEARTFIPFGRATLEDLVTGSFNAALAQWLLGTGRAIVPFHRHRCRPSPGPGRSAAPGERPPTRRRRCRRGRGLLGEAAIAGDLLIREKFERHGPGT
ncbi:MULTISPECIES: PhzF family phenazine biosynthesis protein [Streptosporangium]|uniref:PhzF family phenazine biosynthesis protein n=1 Tax=Streptosporangium TaxID=2000 RepID=UPI0027D87EB3|nr:PhzF family phenazine biosynthesis protein [Streptosporangium brasiliense]